MTTYKAGDKFIIEIETHYNHSGEQNSARPLNDHDGADVSTLYRIRGFKSLVFDAEGLKKLQPLEEMTAEEYLNIKQFYCMREFKENGVLEKNLPDWCRSDFRDPENSIKQIEKLRGEYKKAKLEADRMNDINYELEDVIAEYGIDDVRKALEARTDCPWK